MESIKKIDNYTLEVTKTPVTPEPVTLTYDRNFLEKQLITIQAQQDRDNNQREIEKAEVERLLSLCDEQGIISKSVEISEEKLEEFVIEDSVSL